MVIYLSENVFIHFILLSYLIFFTLFWVLMQWLPPLLFVIMLIGWFLSSFTGMAVLRIVRESVTSVGPERAEAL